jgi:hypothetical protein
MDARRPPFIQLLPFLHLALCLRNVESWSPFCTAVRDDIRVQEGER